MPPITAVGASSGPTLYTPPHPLQHPNKLWHSISLRLHLPPARLPRFERQVRQRGVKLSSSCSNCGYSSYILPTSAHAVRTRSPLTRCRSSLTIYTSASTSVRPSRCSSRCAEEVRHAHVVGELQQPDAALKHDVLVRLRHVPTALGLVPRVVAPEARDDGS